MTQQFVSTGEKVIVSQRIGKAITSRVPANEPIGLADTSYDLGRCKKCGVEVTSWEVYFDSHVCGGK